MKWLTILMALIIVGCASTPEPDDTQDIKGKCESVEARLVMKPWLEHRNKRMMLLVRVNDRTRMIRAVAKNSENERVLALIKAYADRAFDRGISLMEEGKEGEAEPYFIVGMCGEWVEEGWEEFAPGAIDFEIVLIAVYDTWSGRYLTVQTNYGNRWTDAVKSANWKGLIFDLGKKGAGVVIP